MRKILLTSLLCLVFFGCNHPKKTYVTEELETIGVLRIVDKSEIGYEIQGTYPDAPIICEVRFKITAPEKYKDKEILIPIIAGTEGELFERKEFEIILPKNFLALGLTTNKTNPDGTETYTHIDGFGFEGINQSSANKTVGVNFE